MVFFLQFGLPNTLPLRVGIYISRLPMFPVHAHADLVRESNRRLDSLSFSFSFLFWTIGTDAFVRVPGSRERNPSVETTSVVQ